MTEWLPTGSSWAGEVVISKQPSAPLAWMRGTWELGETAASTRSCIRDTLNSAFVRPSNVANKQAVCPNIGQSFFFDLSGT